MDASSPLAAAERHIRFSADVSRLTDAARLPVARGGLAADAAC